MPTLKNLKISLYTLSISLTVIGCLYVFLETTNPQLDEGIINGSIFNPLLFLLLAKFISDITIKPILYFYKEFIIDEDR